MLFCSELYHLKMPFSKAFYSADHFKNFKLMSEYLLKCHLQTELYNIYEYMFPCHFPKLVSRHTFETCGSQD